MSGFSGQAKWTWGQLGKLQGSIAIGRDFGMVRSKAEGAEVSGMWFLNKSYQKKETPEFCAVLRQRPAMGVNVLGP
eukprot:CAMPEP_0174359638 /NCGR_PEP_ID=MMETSP0811_2-20130205/49836_1 /TAXON_ID=73025 ORGANISM="Eutreptiella gymnastica-like, Strain CCMP1594" /NCGR_SAMPLE_ID=MMETSP0811_2 /ASSEMBLY_ACC=CAM_ASM_000667 /LENGTH=75 /DNA_ID=CAMNT_0015494557 /DNA_START=155 /DNA_END=382 /DNA_ORIENTATION=+